MSRTALAETDMSDIEKEFEIEMEDSDERLFEDDSDTELEKEFESLTREDVSDNEWEEEPDNDYAQRLYELSLREFESETELDGAISKILGDVDKNKDQFSFKRMFKKLNLKKLAKNKLVKGLIKKAVSTGLNAVAPGSGIAGDAALSALGFEINSEPDLRNFNSLIRFNNEFYDRLINDQPVKKAYLNAIKSASEHAHANTKDGKVRTIYLKKGEHIKIINV